MSRRHVACRHVALLLGVALGFLVAAADVVPWQSAHAQVLAPPVRSDMPAVTRLTPQGINPGQSAEFTLAGDKLQDIQGVFCTGGVELEKVVQAAGKQAKLLLKAPNDAQPGIYLFHVVCKAGLSNPRLLRIDRYPQVVEKEDNATPDKAQALTLPAAVSGTLQPVDEDVFKFEAAAGQRLVIDVESHRLGLPVRPIITLLDSQRRELANMLTPSIDVSPDARLVHAFREAGTYYLRINDRIYQGGETCGYYLRMGNEVYASEMFPLGGRRGESVEVTFGGPGLERPVVHRVDLKGDVRDQKQRLIVSTPQGTLIGPALFAVGDHPEAIEKEPNDKPNEAGDVNFPVTINGRIAKPGDRDVFRFQAKSGTRLTFRVRARELGSPLDPVISVRNLQGRTLASADDVQAGDRAPPVARPVQMPQNVDDPRLDFTVPADGQYLVSIDDLYYHGGGAYGYRLEIAPPRADFDVLVQPGRGIPANAKQPQQRQQQVLNTFAGQGTGALTIDRGGRGSVAVKIIRQGYNGAVQLLAEGLPPGVTANPATIAAGQPLGEMTFSASFDASNQSALVRIYGVADIGGTKVTRRADHPVLFAAMPQGVVAMHYLDSVAVAVSGQGAELGLRTEVAGTVAPGSKVKVKLSVRRREGLKGEVTVKALSLPDGIMLPEVKIPNGKDTIEVDLAAGATAKPGKRSLQLQAALRVSGQNNPLVAEAPLTVDVQPLLTLELAEERLDLPIGGKKTVQLKITRQASSADPLELETSRLPEGVTVKPLKIPGDAKTVMLEFAAARRAEATAIRRVIELRPRAKVNNQTLELPTLRIALKVVKP
jgi:hypothetical protein